MRSYLARGRTSKAEAVVQAAIDSSEKTAANAGLLHDVVTEVLARGEVPRLLLDAYRAQLDRADAQLAHGRVKLAAESFARAVGLAFSRNIHFDAMMSPLARDPYGFTQPLRESVVAARLRSARGRSVTPSTHDDSSSATDDAPSRIVLATGGNANFLREILVLLESRRECASTFVDFGENRRLFRGADNTALLVEEILTRKGGLTRRVERELRPVLDEADVLFVEWCTALAVLTGLVDPGNTRVIVRLHSFEAFTHWPHLLDFSRIDDVVFVSDHLRDLALDAIPGLVEPGAPRLHVLPLAMDLRAHVRPKTQDARFNVALVGWGSVAKDPAWALEVLRMLRRQDERYKLLLVGSEFAEHASPAAAVYAQRLSAELAPLEEIGAVQRLGPSDDVPAVLSSVGVILSSSVRESFHAALVEGAASGAVPVVRDWPFFASRVTGARTLFPVDWMVRTPEEAVARIIDTTSDADRWRRTGGAAMTHALATWDWEVVKPAYEGLFLGREPARRRAGPGD